MKIKLAPELVEGDIIVHDNKLYKVNKYVQGLGAGSDIFGEYGVLYAQQITRSRVVSEVNDDGGWFGKPIIKSYVDVSECIEKEEDWWSYKNYPFVVVENEEI